ncbi:MAG: PAS domain-containing protein [Methanomicrobium sp.]|nr:PAS domain-containing protein [Methanomicrobium sp.]
MMKILLVDDEPHLLEIGRIFIEKTGDFIVDTASCADEAFFKLDNEEPGAYDAIVSDYEMPGKNGIELLRDIRGKNNNIPFLIFTGRGREDIVVEALESGADFYMQKGGSPKPLFAELTSKIKKAVEKRKADDNHFLDNQRLEAINNILQMREFSFKEIVTHAVSEAVRLTKSSLGYAIFLDESGCPIFMISCIDGEISGIPVSCKPDYLSEKYPEFMQYLEKSGSCLIINDMNQDIFKSPLSEENFPKINRYMAFPLFENSSLTLIAGVGNKKTPYDDSDKRQLSLLITGMWMVAGRKRNEEELVAANEQLAAAYEQLKASEELMQSQFLKLKQSERKLSESEESLSLAIEGAGLGIWDSDISTRKQVVNKIWAEMIGYTCEEVDNVPNFWRDHVHPVDLLDVLNKIDDYSSGKTDNYHVEFRMRCRDGRWKWIASTGKVSERDGDNKPLRISGIHRDITELVAAGKNLATARKKLKMLFGFTRHDILNQVMLISGNAELLKDAFSPDSKDGRCVSAIISSAGVIENHLEFASSYMNLGLNEPVWQNAGEIFKKISEEINRISYDCDEKLPCLNILADPLFFSVMYNIIENSVRHSEKITRIIIGFENSPEFGTLFIEDNGTGIPDNEKELIFKKGFGRNSGTGLFLSREILSVSGIEIYETGVYGKCARFEIKIPVELYYLDSQNNDN